MTRITDLGRKRTHVEATFNYNEPDPEDSDAELSLGGAADGSTTVVMDTQVGTTGDGSGADGQPPKKKRKRGPRRKAGAKVTTATADGDEGREKGEVDGEGAGTESKKAPKPKGKNSKGKFKTLKGSPPLQPPHTQSSPNLPPERKEASENRRRRRIAERNVNTICFACRDKGHAVLDCPKIADGSIKPPDVQNGFSAVGVVGICYRCGSRKHRLSACREKPPDPSNPLPFASCFVCNGNGHLSSQCPKNKEKGVYPNGGCCKLCGETDHLARNCKLRNRGTIDASCFLSCRN